MIRPHVKFVVLASLFGLLLNTENVIGQSQDQGTPVNGLPVTNQEAPSRLPVPGVSGEQPIQSVQTGNAAAAETLGATQNADRKPVSLNPADNASQNVPPADKDLSQPAPLPQQSPDSGSKGSSSQSLPDSIQAQGRNEAKAQEASVASQNNPPSSPKEPVPLSMQGNNPADAVKPGQTNPSATGLAFEAREQPSSLQPERAQPPVGQPAPTSGVVTTDTGISLTAPDQVIQPLKVQGPEQSGSAGTATGMVQMSNPLNALSEPGKSSSPVKDLAGQPQVTVEKNSVPPTDSASERQPSGMQEIPKTPVASSGDLSGAAGSALGDTKVPQMSTGGLPIQQVPGGQSIGGIPVIDLTGASRPTEGLTAVPQQPSPDKRPESPALLDTAANKGPTSSSQDANVERIIPPAQAIGTLEASGPSPLPAAITNSGPNTETPRAPLVAEPLTTAGNSGGGSNNAPFLGQPNGQSIGGIPIIDLTGASRLTDGATSVPQKEPSPDKRPESPALVETSPNKGPISASGDTNTDRNTVSASDNVKNPTISDSKPNSPNVNAGENLSGVQNNLRPTGTDVAQSPSQSPGASVASATATPVQPPVNEAPNKPAVSNSGAQVEAQSVPVINLSTGDTKPVGPVPDRPTSADPGALNSGLGTNTNANPELNPPLKPIGETSDLKQPQKLGEVIGNTNINTASNGNRPDPISSASGLPIKPPNPDGLSGAVESAPSKPVSEIVLNNIAPSPTVTSGNSEGNAAINTNQNVGGTKDSNNVKPAEAQSTDLSSSSTAARVPEVPPTPDKLIPPDRNTGTSGGVAPSSSAAVTNTVLNNETPRAPQAAEPLIQADSPTGGSKNEPQKPNQLLIQNPQSETIKATGQLNGPTSDVTNPVGPAAVQTPGNVERSPVLPSRERNPSADGNFKTEETKAPKAPDSPASSNTLPESASPVLVAPASPLNEASKPNQSNGGVAGGSSPADPTAPKETIQSAPLTPPEINLVKPEIPQISKPEQVISTQDLPREPPTIALGKPAQNDRSPAEPAKVSGLASDLTNAVGPAPVQTPGNVDRSPVLPSREPNPSTDGNSKMDETKPPKAADSPASSNTQTGSLSPAAIPPASPVNEPSKPNQPVQESTGGVAGGSSPAGPTVPKETPTSVPLSPPEINLVKPEAPQPNKPEQVISTPNEPSKPNQLVQDTNGVVAGGSSPANPTAHKEAIPSAPLTPPEINFVKPEAPQPNKPEQVISTPNEPSKPNQPVQDTNGVIAGGSSPANPTAPKEAIPSAALTSPEINLVKPEAPQANKPQQVISTADSPREPPTIDLSKDKPAQNGRSPAEPVKDSDQTTQYHKPFPTISIIELTTPRTEKPREVPPSNPSVTNEEQREDSANSDNASEVSQPAKPEPAVPWSDWNSPPLPANCTTHGASRVKENCPCTRAERPCNAPKKGYTCRAVNLVYSLNDKPYKAKGFCLKNGRSMPQLPLPPKEHRNAKPLPDFCDFSDDGPNAREGCPCQELEEPCSVREPRLVCKAAKPKYAFDGTVLRQYKGRCELQEEVSEDPDDGLDDTNQIWQDWKVPPYPLERCPILGTSRVPENCPCLRANALCNVPHKGYVCQSLESLYLVLGHSKRLGGICTKRETEIPDIYVQPKPARLARQLPAGCTIGPRSLLVKPECPCTELEKACASAVGGYTCQPAKERFWIINNVVKMIPGKCTLKKPAETTLSPAAVEEDKPEVVQISTNGTEIKAAAVSSIGVNVTMTPDQASGDQAPCPQKATPSSPCKRKGLLGKDVESMLMVLLVPDNKQV